MLNMNDSNTVTITVNTLPGHTARLVRDVSEAFNGKAGLYECTPGLGAARLGDMAPQFVVVSAVDNGINGVPDITVFTGTNDPSSKSGLAGVLDGVFDNMPGVLATIVGSNDERAALALLGYALVEDAEPAHDSEDDEALLGFDLGGESE